jgi:protein-S-isoprenylcysteine O-methyltransferase Ste14
MASSLRYILPIYLTLFFALAIAWRSFRVWWRTGINPYALGRTDTVYDFVGRVFKLLVVLNTLIVLVYAFAPAWYHWLTPIPWLVRPSITLIGLALLGVSLIWIVVAQAQMGTAWRIGIDTAHQTELIQSSLFRISRNPIFLGLRITLLGMLLVLPSAATLAVVLAGDVVIQIQVRLEEDYLTRVHGEQYRMYCRCVRRWL